MKIGIKLIIGFLLVIILIGISGYLYTVKIEESFEASIGENSVTLAIEVIDEIDRDIANRIEEWVLYSTDLILQETIMSSNQEFKQFVDIQAYIDQKNKEWVDSPKDEVTPFMKKLIGNRLSQEMRKRLEFYEENLGYRLFGEVFVTNKYGANVAQTGKTSDYYQADETWWQSAKKEGLFVKDVEYDESADVYSTDIGIKIEDGNGNFIGAMKIILNIEEVIAMVKHAELNEKHESGHFKLLTNDGKLIYSKKDFEFLKDVSKKDYFNNINGDSGYFTIKEKYSYGEEEELFGYARSKGYREFKGLGWVLIVEHEIEDVLSPLIELKNVLLIILVVAMLIAITIGLFFSYSISKPIAKLRQTTLELGKGNFDVKAEVMTHDELGDLAITINKIIPQLKHSRKVLEKRVKEKTKELTLSLSKLKNSEKKYRQLSEGLNELIYRADPKTLQPNYVNKAVEDIYGYTVTEWIKNPALWENTLHPKDKKRVFKYMLLMQKAIKNGNISYRIIRKDKSIRWVDDHFSWEKDEAGKIISMNGILYDFTDKKKLEQALIEKNTQLQKAFVRIKQVDKLRTDFFNIATHELRTPLTPLRSHLELLEDGKLGKLNKEQTESVIVLLRNVQRLHNLINQTFDLSRIGAKNHMLHFKKFNLHKVISEALKTITVLAKNRKISVNSSFQKFPPIRFDKEKILEVMTNLLSNAIKFTPKNGMISVQVKRQENHALISVKDTGMGIAKKHHKNLFLAFSQINTIQSRKSESTGLGLSICKRIIDIHHGKIWVESEEGKGSTFYFTLPIKRRKLK